MRSQVYYEVQDVQHGPMPTSILSGLCRFDNRLESMRRAHLRVRIDGQIDRCYDVSCGVVGRVSNHKSR